MINHGKVRSTVKPENTVIDEYSVWVANNINEITIEDIMDNKEKTTHIEYEYELLQYNKDEYIKLMSDQNYETQLALVELYESLGV